jgi:hypothetical protein
MKNIGWFSRLFNRQPSSERFQRSAGVVATAVVLLMASGAVAQNATPAIPTPETQMSVPNGYAAHGTVDVGGRVASTVGSPAMYDTLVNMQTGPRILGGTYLMRALPGKKNTLVDSLMAVAGGFGGDPYSFAKLDFHKGKVYEFSGIFRRDRQYFDYDLLGNPNIPGGESINNMVSGTPTAALPWPQVEQSPVLFNTVRRMTDTNLTIFPLSKVTFRAGYSQDIFQGPSLSPSGYQFAKYDAILQEFQRNSTDDFTGAIDWKPIEGTTLTFAEEIDHYKADSYFTMAAGDFIAQEADGTKVALDNFDSQTPYGIGACTTTSMGSGYTNASNYTILSAPQTPGGLPVINPACAVVTSYLRSQPTRIFYPTEIFRLQSTSIKSIAMNGDVRYTNANMNLPNYYDSYQGLNGTTRSLTFLGNATAKREVLAADYGIVWRATRTFSLSDQVTYSNVQEPGTAVITSATTVATYKDSPTNLPPLPTKGNETINSPTLPPATAAAGASTIEGSPSVGTPQPAYFGQSFLTNDLTGTWDAWARTTLSLTYRHRTHIIAQGSPHNTPLAVTAASNGTVTIDEDGGIFNAAVRPMNNWDINGSVEIFYADNSFTPVGARQTKRYRMHTRFKPRPWATVWGAYSDLERHNNTNNNQALVALFVPAVPPTTGPPPTTGSAASGTPYEGPLDHVDHSRFFSVGGVLAPNEHFGLDFNYAYSDVYTATNICYDNGATATLPGAVAGANAAPCPNVFARGATPAAESSGAALVDWYGRDFMDAPTQSGSVALTMSPDKRIHSGLGYRISSVNGNQFFTDARAVNGSLQSTYESPFVNLAWTIHPGLVWRGEYNFYGYGEGGPSGSQYCSTSTTPSSVPVLCTSLPYPTGLTEPPAGATAPRNFHANNVTFSIQYAF